MQKLIFFIVLGEPVIESHGTDAPFFSHPSKNQNAKNKENRNTEEPAIFPFTRRGFRSFWFISGRIQGFLVSSINHQEDKLIVLLKLRFLPGVWQ